MSECQILGKTRTIIRDVRMNGRENLSTGIYAALVTFLFLICFVGAFVLPSSVVNSKWLGIFGLVGLFIAFPLLERLAHRSRIRQAVEKLGGRILRFKKLWFWDQPYVRVPIFCWCSLSRRLRRFEWQYASSHLQVRIFPGSGMGSGYVATTRIGHCRRKSILEMVRSAFG
jgi:hypothetical protein